MTKYTLTIGLETHVQLKTKSKLFSAADNLASEAEPNTLISHIDFGLPGALPVLNKKALELACRAAFALNTAPQGFFKFDRKHYFYPDLPMGYQISQYDQPIIKGGYVEFLVDGELKRVNIERAHLEADAGKSQHPEGQDYSLVDLNRAGTPLLEIVSRPEMHSAIEARAYAHELYLLMRYADVSDANLYFGNMRFDVNVSVSPDSQLGTRTETKNLNSFRSVERAVTYEMNRQIELIERGDEVIQQTRGWNDTTGRGYALRSKENADDYRYMPDPDLPPVVLDKTYIAQIKDSMPMLPNFWRQSLAAFKLDPAMLASLIDGEVEYSLGHLEYLKDLPSDDAKTFANWIVNIELPLRRKTKESDRQLAIPSEDIHKLYEATNKLVNEGRLSSTHVKELLGQLLTEEMLPKDIAEYAQKASLIQESNVDTIAVIVDRVIKNNPQAVKDIKAGQHKAIAFLVGQVMKASSGQANPGIVTKLIKDKVE